MKKLILLTGLHKTGTTSIQQTCFNNFEQLRAAGFIYPALHRKLGDGKIRSDSNHSFLLGMMFREKGNRPLLQELLAKHEENVILAGEECSLFSIDQLLDLKHYFVDLGYEIKVLCCVRRPSAWLNSMVAQEVIGRRSHRLSLQDALAKIITPAGAIRPRISNIERVFPDAEFFSFAQSLSHSLGPVGNFFERAGIALSKDWVIHKANEGHSDHAVRLSNKINSQYGSRLDSAENNRFYIKLLSSHPFLFAVPGEKFMLHESEIQPFLPIIREENEWLKTRFGEGFFDREFKFSVGPVALDRTAHDFLLRHANAASEPISMIIEQYLQEHSTFVATASARGLRLH